MTSSTHPDLPLVTVAIPTYNRLELLKESLDSAMQQSYPSLEILVSDNCSTDGTEAFMRSVSDPRVRYIRQTQNLGMVGNWNACLDLARGNYFLLLSDDDLLSPKGVEHLVGVFQRHPDSAFVYGKVGAFSSTSGIRAPGIAPPPPSETPDQIIQGFMVWGRPTFACGILYRVPSKSPRHHYDPSYRLLFDAKFWMEELMSSDLPARYTASVVGQYRLHPSNESTIAGSQRWRDEGLRLLDWYLGQKPEHSQRAFARNARFRALARAIGDQPTHRLSRVKEIIGLGFQIQPALLLLAQQVARCFR